MNTHDKVLTLIEQNSGYLTAKSARESGVDNKMLQRMAERGLIERAAHGLYVGTGVFPDPFFIAQYRCPKGIFSHETALFLHDLSDRNPLRIMMTIPAGWNSKLLSGSDMFFFYSSPKYMGLGACDFDAPSGVNVKTYNIERTICDCLRYIDKLDRDMVLTALKQYAKHKERDSSKLLEYASILKIRDIVYRYLEVLV